MTPVPHTATATRGTARAVRRALLALVLVTALGAGVAQAADQSVSTEGIAVRTVAPPCVPAWWDAAYDLRRSIAVTTSTAVGNDHSVTVTLDHAAMVAGATSLASGADVRVVALDTAACTWSELDRVVDDSTAWNTATTRLWFRLATAVEASSSSATAYYLYYDNPSAGAPPANASNVFLRYDDFPGAALGPAWTVTRPPTTWSVSGNELNVTMEPNQNLIAADNAPVFGIPDPTGDIESQVRLTGDLTADGHTAGLLTYQNDTAYAMAQAVYVAGTCPCGRLRLVRHRSGVTSTSGVSGGASPMHLRLTRTGSTYRASFSTDGGVTYSVGTAGTVTLTPSLIALTAFGTSASTTSVSFTNLRVRRTVATEPTLTLGAQVARF